MSKKSSDWYVPPEFSLLLCIATIVVLSAILLPIVGRFKSGDLVGIFYLALVLGGVGSVLLFFARLPLYRKRQFFTFGPGQLSGIHRRLYWLAYPFLLVSIGLLFLIWLRLR
jgi:hypothetical protein